MNNKITMNDANGIFEIIKDISVDNGRRVFIVRRADGENDVAELANNEFRRARIVTAMQIAAIRQYDVILAARICARRAA